MSALSRPGYDRRLMEADPIDAVFGPEGAFARAWPGYAPRQGQIDFSRACADAFRDGFVVIAEAATGTGKSIAYLVPAIQRIAERGGRVVIVTSNIALQEQLIKKDLPTLQGILEYPFTFAIAKGWSNYLCKSGVADLDDMVAGDKLAGMTAEELASVELVKNWVTTTGDMSELGQELPAKVRRLVTIPGDECPKRKCGFYEGCHAVEARRAFTAAQVVVTNYHLYCIDLAVRMRGGRGVLPQHDMLVMDEAHEMPAIAREYFGIRSGYFAIRSAVAELDAKGKRAERLGLPRELAVELKMRVEREADRFFGELHALRRSDRYKARLDRPRMIDGMNLQSLLKEAAAAYAAGAADPDVLAEGVDFLRDRQALCLKHSQLIEDARQVANESRVYFLDELNGGQRTGLASLPISAAEFLKRSLWPTADKSAMTRPRSIVLCSATLATSEGENGFDYFAGLSGVDAERAEQLIVRSPFDYSRVALYVPQNISEPSAKTFADEVGEELVDLVARAGGRTLGLFTSYRGLEAAHRALLSARLPYRVLKQGDYPRTTLIRMFKEDETSVLLGTDSFWTGVDVPGPALSALLIDKFPFTPPTDPILSALEAKHGRAAFRKFSLPAAIERMKQGFGRLIRTTSDYGAVVICDRRLVDKDYGRDILDALPKGFKLSRDPASIDRILAKHRATAAA